MIALFLNLLLLVSYQPPAQVPLPTNPDPSARTQVDFMETDFTVAVTRADMGITGPVNTVTTRRVWVKGSGPEAVVPTGFGPRGAGPMAIRHSFDESGYLTQIEELDSDDWPRAKYIYDFADGTYRGYEHYGVDPYGVDRGTGSWILKESLVREEVSSREVVFRVRTPISVNLSVKSKDVHLLYDEHGRLVAEERFDPDGTFRNRTTHRYRDGRLVETTEGVSTTTYSYNPEQLPVGSGLLVARRSFSRSKFRVIGRDGQLLFDNSEGKDLLRAGSDFFYQPDGELAEIRHFRVSYESGEAVERIFKVERFRNGVLIEETDYARNVTYMISTREYDASRLIRTTRRVIRQEGTVMVTRCEYRDFDQYGNWTLEHCSPQMEEDELHESPNTFRGQYKTRFFTYY